MILSESVTRLGSVWAANKWENINYSQSVGFLKIMKYNVVLLVNPFTHWTFCLEVCY